MENLAEEKQLLEKFARDEDLNKLEKKFNKFNIFDCLQLTRAEIRHSNFLAWLLNPNENHGLNDYFLKEFLKNTLPDTNDWDMQDAEVLREHENIDLLIIDEKNKFIVVIENKIDSFQHDNQLERYKTYIDKKYPDKEYRKSYIYLKPTKEKVEKPYIHIDYSLIKKALDETLKAKEDKINHEIIIAIKHYRDILERDFMQKNEISVLCRKIYKKHKTAIDLINKYSDTKTQMFEILQEALEEQEGLDTYHIENNNGILCLPDKIEDLGKFQFANWKPDNYIIYLNFINSRYGRDDIYLEILLGPINNNALKGKKDSLINHLEKSLDIEFEKKNPNWQYSKAKSLLKVDDFYKQTQEEAKEHLKKKLNEIKEKYIDNLRNALNSWEYEE